MGKAKQTGKLLVIEGLDGGGKKTQSNLLYNHLLEDGFKTKLISFPLYDTPAGKLVAAYLQGEIGNKEDVPPELPALFYALDRYQAKWDIEQLLEDGYIVVVDRYSPSNLAFQTAKFPDKKKKEFLKWIEIVESRVPTPDRVFYMNVPIATIRQWIKNRNQREFELTDLKDIHERDYEYQQKVQKMYIKLAKKHKWEVINYATSSGTIRSRSSIHKEIWERVEKLLG